MLFRRLNLSSEIFSRLLLPSCVFLPPATPPKGGWDGRQTRETHPAPADPERERIPWVIASDPGAIYVDASQRLPSLTRRLHFVDPVTLDAGLRVMLFNRFEVRAGGRDVVD